MADYWDHLWVNVHLLTSEGKGLGRIMNAALAVHGDKIAWLGPMDDLPGKPNSLAKRVYSHPGKWLSAGLIDCHTHLVYASNRAQEFTQRLAGKSYTDIANAGGGILATVNMTRAATEEELLQASIKRLIALATEGVTTVEIKSGYGLDLETEAKMLRVARRLEQLVPVTVKTSYLGAHAIPPEYKDNPDAYIDLICDEILPQLVKDDLVDAVDGCCEAIGFSPEQINHVFACADALGIPVKLHAEQFSEFGGAKMATHYHAMSIDHLEYAAQSDIAAMAHAGCVAVLLPGAYYYLQERQKPSVDLLRRYHVPIAIATDCNPGSSPMTSLLMTLNMACLLFGLTVDEAILGVTRHAAKALGIDGRYGSLAVDKFADLVLWDITDPAELVYHMGFNPVLQVVKKGNIVLERGYTNGNH